MSLKLVILCHVEPGLLRNGQIVYGFDHPEGITIALPRILEFADRCGVPLGLALTPQALSLVDADFEGHDAGVHLHPRDPVLSRHLGGGLRVRHDCLGRYAADEQGQLIRAARQVFEDVVGRSPRLFVAGRWSEDSSTTVLLQEEGFTHDASALPGHRSPCADWSRLPRLAQPYHPAAEDRQRAGGERLLYLPVCRGLWQDYMTPERIGDVGRSYFEAALKEAQVGGAEVIQFYFHSPLGLDGAALAAFEDVLAYAHDAVRATPVRPTSLGPSARFEARSFPPAYLARLDWTMAKSLVGRNGLGRRMLQTVEVPADLGGLDPRVGERPLR